MESGNTDRPHRVRRRKTTVIGVVILVLGAFNLAWIVAVYVGIGVADTQGVDLESYGVRLTPLMIAISGLGLVKGTGLIAAGTAIVRRSRYALTFFTVTFVVSLLHSAAKIVQYIELDRPGAGAEEGALEGFWLGITCSNLVSITLYLAVIAYLRSPATRRELDLAHAPFDGVFE